MRVTLARDPFGTRQLYVARVAGSGGWLFASTIRPHPRERAPRAAAQRPHDLPLPLLPRARRRPRDLLRGHRAGRRGRVHDADAARGAERHLWSSLRDELEATPRAAALRRARRRGLPAPADRGRAPPPRRAGSARRSPAASTPPPSWRSSTVSPAPRRPRRSTCSRRGRSSSPTRVPTRCATSTTSSGPSATGSRPIAWSRPRPTSRTTCATSCASRRSRSSRPAPTPSSASCARPRRATQPRPPCSTGTAATRLSAASGRTTSSTCAS